MARKATPLTDARVKQAKPGAKPFRLFDGRGLFLLVSPSGSKLWRLKYRFRDTERLTSLGMYPQISLAEARDRAREYREAKAHEIDPREMRQAARRALKDAATPDPHSFEVIALEWFERNRSVWKPSHAETVISRLRNDVFPWIGEHPVREITAADLLPVLRRVEDRGALDTARRERQILSMVFKYAVATARCDRDPAADLRGALTPPVKRNYPAVTNETELGSLLSMLWGYSGSRIVQAALRLAPMLALRPGELRSLRWEWVDLDKALIEIPGEYMKAGEPHLVPLAPQAVDVFNEVKPFSEGSPFVFPSGRTRGRCMSEGAVHAALRRMGISKDNMVGHSFRTTFSTLANESGRWTPDAIEAQLAHTPKDRIRAVYNRARYMDERRKLMVWWAAHLERLRLGFDRRVVSIGERP